MKKKVYVNEDKLVSLLMYVGIFLMGLTIFSKAFGWGDMANMFAIVTALYGFGSIVGFYFVPTKKVNNKEEK